jgi:hypothetical protein
MRAMTDIPANTASPIGRTDRCLPGSTKAAAEVDDAAGDDVAWKAAAVWAGTPLPALLGAGGVGMTVGTADDGTVEMPCITATDVPDEVAGVMVAALVVVSTVAEGIEVTVETPLTFAGESVVVVGDGNSKVVGAVVLATAIDDDDDDVDAVVVAKAAFGNDVVVVVDELVDDNGVRAIGDVGVVALVLVLVDDVPTVSGGEEVFARLLGTIAEHDVTSFTACVPLAETIGESAIVHSRVILPTGVWAVWVVWTVCTELGPGSELLLSPVWNGTRLERWALCGAGNALTTIPDERTRRAR